MEYKKIKENKEKHKKKTVKLMICVYSYPNIISTMSKIVVCIAEIRFIII